MKLNPISEALLWLPGFGPGEDPLALRATQGEADKFGPGVLDVVTSTRPATALDRVRVPARPPKAVWPMLEATTFDGVHTPIQKYEANMEAIECLRSLESEGRTPTEAERVVLNRFTGWGGCPNVFSLYQYDAAWKTRQEQLKSLLTPEEYAAASASTPNAHYTSVEVVQAIWQALARLGFQGGRILEPAAGVGYFLGAMPKEIAQASTITAVELEPVTARILKALYAPFGVKVVNQAFERFRAPEGHYDLVISNVPFGNYQVAEERKVPFQDFLIHDYFIARALEVVRVGGLVAVITSAGTMDKQNTKAREYFAAHADLLAAIRLPCTAFKKIANTEVTTDILILRRKPANFTDIPTWARDRAHISAGDPRLHLTADRYGVTVNSHFADEDSRWVIGKMGLKSNGYGLANAVFFDGDLVEALAERVGWLPEGIYTPRVTPEVEVTPRALVAAETKLYPGAFALTEDGKVAVATGDGTMLEVLEGQIPQAHAIRIRAMIGVRDAARKLVTVQAATEDDAKVEVYRIALNAAYDAFVAKYGCFHLPKNIRLFRRDPDFPLLLSLEVWDEKTKTAEKAAIFRQRTVGVIRRVERCETPEEALLTCLAERGRVVIARIAELLETDEDTAINGLAERGLLFLDPASGQWVERDAYLSGNVRRKLHEAIEAGPGFERNVKALESVLPDDIPPEKISVALGATWVPASDYEAFIRETITQQVKVLVKYDVVAGRWLVRPECSTRSVEVEQTWGTKRVNAFQLIEMAMNLQAPKVTDKDPNDPAGKRRIPNAKETVAAREKQEAIKEAFVKWIWQDDARTLRLVRAYNDERNAIVNRTYDGTHLVLPGFSNAYTLRKNQKDVVWRIIASQNNTLMAHCVGAGKTLAMICAGMEARRMGLANKPMYAVPNHMLEQFAGEFIRAYPGARVLVASKDDMAPDNRALLLAKIATGDWDAVIVTHASFEKIALPESFVRRHIDEVKAEIRWAKSCCDDAMTVKRLESQLNMWDARLTKLSNMADKDKMLTFDQIGVDMLFVDEAHLFKNLYRITSVRAAGLPTNDSLRSFDMLLKTRYVMQSRQGRNNGGVVFATGTPIANSIAEMWVMQHYLQPHTLREHGVHHFDAWLLDFARAVTGIELAPDGSGYRVHERFAQFVNVPELMTMFREVADIRTREMLDLPTPETIRETVVAKPSAALKKYIAKLVFRAECIRGEHGDDNRPHPSDDNMLLVTTDGRKAATDLRLVGIQEDNPGSKVNLCVAKVHEIWQETADIRGTQIVFLDVGTPSPGRGWNLYDDMRAKLVARGVPLEQIAFIHDYDSDRAKEALFKSVRDGEVRILFGSTSKMGVGTNVQTRLVALHHLDAPWRPADVEQRDGRIERQGNLNGTVRIFRYVTEGSFDSYIWQTLETKAKFIAQVMAGDAETRTMEDVALAALSYAEVKALASGNPLVIEKAGIDAEVMRLKLLRSQWAEQQWKNRRDLALLPDAVAKRLDLLARLEVDVAEAKKLGDRPVFELDGMPYGDHAEVGKRILGAMLTARMGQSKRIGRVGAFTLVVDGPRSLMDSPTLSLEGAASHTASDGDVPRSPRGIVNRILEALDGMAERADRVRERIRDDQVRIEQLTAVVQQPFQHEERYQTLLARKAEVDAALGVREHESDQGAATIDVDEAAEAA